MAEITTFPLLRHLRAEPTAHVLHYRRGTLARDGAGLAFWFRPIHTAVAEVPIDDRELPFLFHVRSADFQELTVQGAIAFRVADPRCSLAASTSRSTSLGAVDAGPARAGRGAAHPARAAVRDRRARAARPAHDPRRRRRADPRPHRGGLAGEPALGELGLEVVAVRVGGGGADRRGREGAAPADPRGDPAAGRRGRRSRAARGHREGAGDHRAGRRQPGDGGAGRPTSARGSRPGARPTPSTWSRRRGCAPSASARRSRPRCRPRCCWRWRCAELAGGLDELTVTPDLLAPLLKRLAA